MSDIVLAVKTFRSKGKSISRGSTFNYFCEYKDDGLGKDNCIYHIYNERYSLKYRSKEEYTENFVRMSDYFLLKYQYIKKVFGFNIKKEFRVSFSLSHLSITALKQFHMDVIYYLEQIESKIPDVLISFEDTIRGTLDKLEKASKLLNEEDFIKVVISSKPVFEEMYKMSLSLYKNKADLGLNEKNEVVKTFINEFKKEMDIKSEVLKDLNDSSRILNSLNELKKLV